MLWVSDLIVNMLIGIFHISVCFTRMSYSFTSQTTASLLERQEPRRPCEFDFYITVCPKMCGILLLFFFLSCHCLLSTIIMLGILTLILSYLLDVLTKYQWFSKTHLVCNFNPQNLFSHVYVNGKISIFSYFVFGLIKNRIQNRLRKHLVKILPEW